MFEFIVSLIRIYRLLHPLTGTSNCLQDRVADIINTYDDISSVIKDENAKKSNISEQFSVIFKGADKLAERIDTQHSVPCIAQKQMNRDNAETYCPEAYYKQAFSIPFIGILISDLELRLTNYHILPQGCYC